MNTEQAVSKAKKEITKTKKENIMKHYEIIKKLIGPIDPVGETNEDEKRKKSLQDTIHLVSRLVDDLEGVAQNADHHAHSVRSAGETASRFLKELRGGNDI